MSDKQKIVAKLIKIYEAIDAVEKGGHNNSQNYDYVRAADVVRAIRAELIRNSIYAEINFDFVDLPYTIARAKEPTAPFSAVNVKCSIVLHDQESGETMTGSGLGTGADTSDKSVYKAQTGATKYALRNVGLLPDEADPEADERVDERARPQQQRPAQTQRPTQAAKPAAAKAHPATGATAPNTKPSTSSAATQSKPVESATSTPTPAPVAGNPAPNTMPTEAEMNEFRAKFDKLRERLCKEGKLKASTNPVIPTAVKLKNFMTSIEGVKTPNDMSKVQWEDFFSRADHVAGLDNGWVGLAKLVNKANGIEEAKK